MAIRITQAGVALTVGIIIVTGLIIGGFFFAKNTSEQARREEAVKIAEQKLKDDSNTEVSLNDGDAKKDATEPAKTDDATKNDTATTNTSSAPAAGSPSTQQPAGELPQTGPADQLATLVTVALVTFAVVSYISSRRSIFSVR
jgi:FtsZ-interacting cell division protein ZipA